MLSSPCVWISHNRCNKFILVVWKSWLRSFVTRLCQWDWRMCIQCLLFIVTIDHAGCWNSWEVHFIIFAMPWRMWNVGAGNIERGRGCNSLRLSIYHLSRSLRRGCLMDVKLWRTSNSVAGWEQLREGCGPCCCVLLSWTDHHPFERWHDY